MRTLNTLNLPSLIILLVASNCPAWLRMPYEDETVVHRSDLIVVAAIKEGAVRYIPHSALAGEGHSWEHHVVLKVSTVVKGEWKLREIPVVINYGLDPDNGTRREHGPTSQPVETKAPLAIDDTGSGMGPVAITADALQENLWFLRIDKAGMHYIDDPDDLQPIVLKDYLACYLAKDTEAAVRAQLQRQPEIAARATRYLAHAEIERISRIPDATVRAERLIPYLLARYRWTGGGNARNALVDCGTAAGPYLMAAYELTDNDQLHEEIIDLLGRTKYTGAVDMLIGLLQYGNRYWASEKLEPGWWDDQVDSPRTRARRAEWGNNYMAVLALEQIGSPRAREAIEATRRSWAAITFENPQMVKACEHALTKLDGKPK